MRNARVQLKPGMVVVVEGSDPWQGVLLARQRDCSWLVWMPETRTLESYPASNLWPTKGEPTIIAAPAVLKDIGNRIRTLLGWMLK